MKWAMRTNADPLDRVDGSKIQIAGWTVYSVLMLALKLSMLSFFIRLTVDIQDD
jgi:hypothetical protein